MCARGVLWYCRKEHPGYGICVDKSSAACAADNEAPGSLHSQLSTTVEMHLVDRAKLILDSPVVEEVDSLAHSATILECHYFTKVYDYFHSFSSFLFSHWQSFWPDLSNIKLCAVKPSISPWSYPGHKNRRLETALTRLHIDYNNLTHSYLMTHSPPTLCMTCNTLLSVSHIKLFCPYTAAWATPFPHLIHLSRPLYLDDILIESLHFHLDNIIFFLQNV